MEGADQPPAVLFDFSPDFDLTQDVKFKYVLIEICCPFAAGQKRLLVRGWTNAEFHADIVEECERQEAIRDFRVLGGGRIQLTKKRTVFVYGHSLGFPWSAGDHKRNELVAEIIRNNLASLSDVTVSWANEGY